MDIVRNWHIAIYRTDVSFRYRSDMGRCHFLAAMQESNQRKWHRGGADREACLSCVFIPSFFPGFEPPSPMYPFRRWSEEWLWSNLSKSDSCCITNALLGIEDKTN